ncbi:putative uncharacterized protein YGR160W [Panicum virgatum]|uniref:putative uncharacterized protein YGR160W n=1 Tax=Panicum virgatum TaxID=38727 RepID=UPI0019D57B5D|nr:putative uncharacterized protein YGR160W [Panicum virgatum]
MMRGGLPSCSRRSPHSDDVGDLGHQPSSTNVGRGGAAGSPPRSQHSSAVVAPSSSTSTASSPPSTSTSMVNIPAEAFDSDSDTQTETEPDDDYRRGYHRAVPRGPALRIISHVHEGDEYAAGDVHQHEDADVIEANFVDLVMGVSADDEEDEEEYEDDGDDTILDYCTDTDANGNGDDDDDEDDDL